MTNLNSRSLTQRTEYYTSNRSNCAKVLPHSVYPREARALYQQAHCVILHGVSLLVRGSSRWLSGFNLTMNRNIHPKHDKKKTSVRFTTGFLINNKQAGWIHVY